MTRGRHRCFENANYLERNGAGAEPVAGLYWGVPYLPPRVVSVCEGR